MAEAAATLQRELLENPGSDRIQTDAERLERLARDLQRRVAAARDAAASVDLDEASVSEMHRLDDYAREMLQAAEQARSSELSG